MKNIRQQGRTRRGWSDFYAKRFNKTGDAQAEHLAMWYLLLAEAFDNE